MNNNNIIDKPIAVITGVSSGIGREMVHELISQGYFVCGCARRQEKVEELQKQYNNKKADFSIVDVSNEQAMEKWCNRITNEIGIPRILIANAAVLRAGTVPKLTANDFDQLFNINVKGSFLLIKNLLPSMQSEQNKGNQCGIFGVSSAAGRQGMPKMSLYCASKFALEGFFASLAQELQGSNIMCASYDPGVVSTGMTAQMPNTNEWVSSQEEGKAAVGQFLEKINKGKEYNGKQLTTSLINDERRNVAFGYIMQAMAQIQ